MNRQTALERLDAIRVGSDDFSDPEMAGLADALAGDDGLQEEFDRRRDWDARIAGAVRDVPVPDGLKDRLITRLSQAEGLPTRPVTTSRRRMLATFSALAAGLAAGIVYWTVTGMNDPVTTAEARDAAEQVISAQTDLVPFDGRFTPSLPDRWQRQLRVHQPAYGVLGPSGSHRAAAWHVSSHGGGEWHAVVVAVPVGDFASPPEATSISDRDYVPGGNMKGIQTVRWTQDGFVYVCCVDRLDALIAELENAPLA